MHRNADGPRLIGDGAGDGLADPPGRIGRELVAPAVLELVDRLHQADVAFLDKIEELEAAVGVLLGDRDDEAQVGLDHFLLGPAGLALALLHRGDDALELGDVETDGAGEIGDLATNAFDLVAVAGGVALPAGVLERRDPAQPARVKLVAGIGLDELDPDHLAALGHAHEVAFAGNELAVDGIELGDQPLDAVVVEMDAVHQLVEMALGANVALFVLVARRRALERRRQALFLELADFAVGAVDFLESGQHLGQQRRLHGGQRQGVVLVVVVIVVAGRGAGGLAAAGCVPRGLSIRCRIAASLSASRRFGGSGFPGRRTLTVGGVRAVRIVRIVWIVRIVRIVGVVGVVGVVGAAIGGVQVDDVAQQDLAILQGLAPFNNGGQGQGAFANPADHLFAAGPRCAWR